MKKYNIFVFLIFFGALQAAFTNGKDECMKVLDALSELQLEKKIIPLLPSLSESPFNIETKFADTGTESAQEKIVIAFTIRDASKYFDFIQKFIILMEKSELKNSASFVFYYDEFSPFENEATIKGSEKLLSPIENKNSVFFVRISLSGENAVIKSADNFFAPFDITKRLCKELQENNFIVRDAINADEKEFFYAICEKGGEALCINYSLNDDEAFISSLLSTLKNYTASSSSKYFVLHVFGKSLFFTEFTCLATLFATLFISLFILTELSFLTQKSRRKFKKLFKISFPLLPLFFIICYFSAVFSKILSQNFNFYPSASLLSSLVATILSLLFASKLRIITPGAFYLISISSIFNILIFSLTDISQVFIFIPLYCIFLAAFLIKKPLSLAAAFFAAYFISPVPASFPLKTLAAVFTSLPLALTLICLLGTLKRKREAALYFSVIFSLVFSVDLYKNFRTANIKKTTKRVTIENKKEKFFTLESEEKTAYRAKLKRVKIKTAQNAQIIRIAFLSDEEEVLASFTGVEIISHQGKNELRLPIYAGKEFKVEYTTGKHPVVLRAVAFVKENETKYAKYVEVFKIEGNKDATEEDFNF